MDDIAQDCISLNSWRKQDVLCQNISRYWSIKLRGEDGELLSIYKSLDTELVATCDGSFGVSGTKATIGDIGCTEDARVQHVNKFTPASSLELGPGELPCNSTASTPTQALEKLIHLCSCSQPLLHTRHKLNVHYGTQTRWGDQQRKGKDAVD